MGGFNPIEIQQAVFNLLDGDTTLDAMVNGIHDYVPQESAFPYITISEQESRDWSTKTTSGTQMALTLHVYSRARGKKETAEILERLHVLLHQGNLSLTGQHLVAMRFELGDIQLEADAITYHGRIRFRIFAEEIAMA